MDYYKSYKFLRINYVLGGKNMDRKKIFVFGAVVFLILTSISPMINGLEFKTEKINKNGNEKSFGNGIVHCKIKRCEFTEFLYIKAVVVYEVDWVVWSENDYMEVSGECALKVDGRVIDSWHYHIGFMEQGESGTRRLMFRSSEIPSVDEERNFAGKIATLEVYSDSVLEDSYNFFVKYWKEDSDYVTTNSQIEVSTPSWFNKIYCIPQIPDLYKLDFFDVRILPNILKSQRMGWTGEAAKYFIQIGENATELLGASIAFLLIIKDDLKILTEWIIDFITWFYSAIKGNIFGIFQIIHDFIQFVLPAVDRILTEATLFGGTVSIIGQKLTSVIDGFYGWILDEPWKKSIKIHVTVDNVAPDEIVTLMCRNASNELCDSDDDGRIDYDFEVDSSPMYKEKCQEGIHNCMVIVKGSKHINPVSSIPILSYAFANGSLYWQFLHPGTNRKEKIEEKIYFVDELYKFSEKQTTSKFFYKLIRKN